jgi:hypothetical protein
LDKINNIKKWSYFLAWVCNKPCHKNFQKTKDYVGNQTLQTRIKKNKKLKKKIKTQIWHICTKLFQIVQNPKSTQDLKYLN